MCVRDAVCLQLQPGNGRRCRQRLLQPRVVSGAHATPYDCLIMCIITCDRAHIGDVFASAFRCSCRMRCNDDTIYNICGFVNRVYGHMRAYPVAVYGVEQTLTYAQG